MSKSNPISPELATIRDEALRLGEFVVSTGHLADVLGVKAKDVATCEAARKFAADNGLTVEAHEPDGVLFRAKKAEPPR